MFLSQDVAKDRYLEGQLLSVSLWLDSILDLTGGLSETIRTSNTDFHRTLQLTVLSGILDVVTFVNYRVFCSKQTGNVLFLAIYVFSKRDLRSKVEQNVVIFLLSFCIGSFLFGRMAHRTRPRRRSWLLSTNLIQTALMFLAACLCWTSTSKDLTSASALVVVGHLAFAASGQTSLAVTVGLPELNTTMVTGAIISTLNDPRLSQGDNAARNRRLLYILSYASGCIIGATMSFGTAGSLFFVSAMKLVVTASFLLNRGRVAGRFIEAGGLRDENYELATTLSKTPLSPWRN